jgi:hypothetical protein
MSSESMIERAGEIPRWALERAEEEKSRYFGVVPNPANVGVWLRDPLGWSPYFALAAYIARMEAPVDEAGIPILASRDATDEALREFAPKL